MVHHGSAPTLLQRLNTRHVLPPRNTTRSPPSAPSPRHTASTFTHHQGSHATRTIRPMVQSWGYVARQSTENKHPKAAASRETCHFRTLDPVTLPQERSAKGVPYPLALLLGEGDRCSRVEDGTGPHTAHRNGRSGPPCEPYGLMCGGWMSREGSGARENGRHHNPHPSRTRRGTASRRKGTMGGSTSPTRAAKSPAI